MKGHPHALKGIVRYGLGNPSVKCDENGAKAAVSGTKLQYF
jgi:hypothetical protein